MENTKLVSIIIPCYNSEDWIAETIQSCLSQTYNKPIEIIVINDGSTDNSLQQIEKYKNYIVLESGPNQGSCHARNKGIKLSTGYYIMFLDSDDVILPTTIEALVNALDNMENKIAVCPWYHYIKDGERWVIAKREDKKSNFSMLDDIRRDLRGDGFPIHAALWPRVVVESVGEWDQTTVPNDDGDFRMRALLQGSHIIRIQQGGAYYRVHSTKSLSNNTALNAFKGRLRTLNKITESMISQDILRKYQLDLAKAYHNLARTAFEMYPEIGRESLRESRKLGGYRAINGSRLHILLCYIFGLERKTKLAIFLETLGVARKRRIQLRLRRHNLTELYPE